MPFSKALPHSRLPWPQVEAGRVWQLALHSLEGDGGIDLRTAEEEFGCPAPETTQADEGTVTEGGGGAEAAAQQPGLGAEVLFGVGPVAQDVVDFRHHVRRHLGENLDEKDNAGEDTAAETAAGGRPHLYGSEVLSQLLRVGRSQEDRAHAFVPETPGWRETQAGVHSVSTRGRAAPPNHHSKAELPED